MNKRLVIIFSSIVLVVMLVVLGAVVLTVGNVQVVTNDEQGKYDMTDIVNESGIKRGSSIFAVDEENAINNIENGYPYVKVIKIERKFPNKVVVEISDRTPILAMPIAGQDSYAMLDREFKILDVVKGEQLDNRLTIVKGQEITLIDGQAESDLAGEFLNINANAAYKYIHDCVLAFEEYGDVNERFTAIVASIEWLDKPSKQLVVTTNLGIKMAFLLDANKSVGEQMKVVYNELNRLDGKTRESDMYIYLNTDGKVVVGKNLVW